MKVASFNYTLRFFPEGREDPLILNVTEPLVCSTMSHSLRGLDRREGTNFFIDWKHVGLHLEVIELGDQEPYLIDFPIVNNFRKENNLSNETRIETTMLLINSNFSHFCDAV